MTQFFMMTIDREDEITNTGKIVAKKIKPAYFYRFDGKPLLTINPKVAEYYHKVEQSRIKYLASKKK